MRIARPFRGFSQSTRSRAVLWARRKKSLAAALGGNGETGSSTACFGDGFLAQRDGSRGRKYVSLVRRNEQKKVRMWESQKKIGVGNSSRMKSLKKLRRIPNQGDKRADYWKWTYILWLLMMFHDSFQCFHSKFQKCLHYFHGKMCCDAFSRPCLGCSEATEANSWGLRGRA